jgi:hypothetical protein
MIPEAKNVREIVAQWLREHGYDGLYWCSGDEGCGCRLQDFIPCGEILEDCCPGYLQEDPEDGRGLLVGPNKPQEPTP